MSKTIQLTQGKIAIVDDEDYERLININWSASYDGWHWYAVANAKREPEKRRRIKMHRLILGLTNPDIKVDHINGDGLDNRRENLRPATSTKNQRNAKRRRDNTSGYKGVSFRKDTKKYRAYINGEGGKRIYIGEFDDPKSASLAYDKKAKEIDEEFFKTNSAEYAERKEVTV